MVKWNLLFILYQLLFREYTCRQGPRSPLKSEGAQGGYFFSWNFLLHFWAIWKNDPFSKFQKVGGLKPPPLPLLVRGPWSCNSWKLHLWHLRKEHSVSVGKIVWKFIFEDITLKSRTNVMFVANVFLYRSIWINILNLCTIKQKNSNVNSVVNVMQVQEVWQIIFKLCMKMKKKWSSNEIFVANIYVACYD